jgi:hypothetical protein
LSINSRNKVNEILGLKIHHTIIMEKEKITHRMKDIARKVKIKRESPRCRKKRVTIILRKTPKSGVSSKKAPGLTPMNVA